MPCEMTRRRALTVGAVAAGSFVLPHRMRADDEVPVELPASPVAVAKCDDYGENLQPTLDGMFEQLGGLAQLVEGKNVAVKINMVSDPWSGAFGLPVEMTTWTHPAVILATVSALGRAGSASVKIVECCGQTILPFEEYIQQAGWNPQSFYDAAPNVSMLNTNGPGPDGTYGRVTVPSGGLVFPAYDLNPAYVDCDVLVSIPKMKEHHWFGVTLSMKNCYGMTPLNIYGTGAGTEEPSVDVQGTRVQVFHNGERAPSLTAPQELDPSSPREGGYRIPRIVAEIVSARPIHLAVIDGISTMCGGEGPWYPNINPVNPGVLLAGFNPVTTDAVAMAVMGFDPAAERGTTPFEGSDSFLTYAEQLQLGTRDLSKIEVLGTSIEDARFDFRAHWPQPEAESAPFRPKIRTAH